MSAISLVEKETPNLMVSRHDLFADRQSLTLAILEGQPFIDCTRIDVILGIAHSTTLSLSPPPRGE